MLRLARYEIDDVVAVSAESRVLRGRRAEDGERLIIKMPAADHRNRGRLLGLRWVVHALAKTMADDIAVAKQRIVTDLEAIVGASLADDITFAILEYTGA